MPISVSKGKWGLWDPSNMIEQAHEVSIIIPVSGVRETLLPRDPQPAISATLKIRLRPVQG